MSTTSRPLVTVVTPSYNYGRYVASCLDSVRSQTWTAIEHIVLDAGSTDETHDVLRSFEGTYDLHVIVGPDGGQADALNRGFTAARGDVYCWLNADDYWLAPDVVERAVAELAAGADVVTAGGCYVDELGIRRGAFPFAAENRLAELRYGDTILQPATFWRRAVHRRLAATMHYAFDWRLWLDMVHAGARVTSRADEWAAYRLHGVNKTALDPARRKREIAQVLGEEFGTLSPQHLWAQVVYRCYAVAERKQVRAVKTLAARANGVVGRLTRYRVFSS